MNRHALALLLGLAPALATGLAAAAERQLIHTLPV